MIRKHNIVFLLSVVALWVGMSILPMLSVTAQENTIHGLLFFSPSCAHCHIVMDEVLPPLAEQYAGKLEIVAIDLSYPDAISLFRAALQIHALPMEQAGVPLLIVGDEMLIGSVEIPSRLPEIIEAGLATGGIPWPDIEGLEKGLSANYATYIVEISSPTTSSPAATLNWVANFQRDLTGNSLAVIVLIGMIVVMSRSIYLFSRKGKLTPASAPKWLVPAFVLVGLGVAIYLAYVETTLTEAICGPIGDCNTVQQSPYARLFGVIPIGIVGMVGYLAIGATWISRQYGPTDWQTGSDLAIWAMSLAGVGFSIYLTFLEPFVIGATCLWCLTSAIIMTILLWSSTENGIIAYQSITRGDAGAKRKRSSAKKV